VYYNEVIRLSKTETRSYSIAEDIKEEKYSIHS